MICNSYNSLRTRGRRPRRSRSRDAVRTTLDFLLKLQFKGGLLPEYTWPALKALGSVDSPSACTEFFKKAVAIKYPPSQGWLYGLKERAGKMAEEMAEGYAAGIFHGGAGTGHEFRSWEGRPTGYEGTLIGCFGPLYAIAIEQGVLNPSAPEWWPENG